MFSTTAPVLLQEVKHPQFEKQYCIIFGNEYCESQWLSIDVLNWILGQNILILLSDSIGSNNLRSLASSLPKPSLRVKQSSIGLRAKIHSYLRLHSNPQTKGTIQ